jgi:hypothetical protein
MDDYYAVAVSRATEMLDEDRHHTADIFHNLCADHPRELIWCRVAIIASMDMVIYRGETKEEVEANRAIFRLSTTYSHARRVKLEIADD